MKKAAKKILEADHLLVVSHRRPDGDSIGSQLGLTSALRKLNKKVICMNEDPVPEMFSFLKNKRDIKQVRDFGKKIDLIICLDISNLERLGEKLMNLVVNSGKPVINIDHHASNEMFADINVVDTSASSTSELVYRLLKLMKHEISATEAESLLAGIVTDTGSFKFSNTSPLTLKVTADLMSKGADLSRISSEVYMSKPLAKVKLTSLVMERMETLDDKAYSYILGSDFKKLGAKMEYTDGIVNEILYILGINFAVLITEERDGFCRLSFRSKDKKYDANRFARRFSGGGHVFAAGGKSELTAGKTIEKLKKELLKL